MRSIVRSVYWKVIAVIARISRSVHALNDGAGPLTGSASTGPYQPLSALRDSVGLLGATAGKIESRLADLSWSTAGSVDRLQHALVLAELSKLPMGSNVAIVGDRPALAVADDLADLGFVVTVFDTVSSADHRTAGWVHRVPLSEANGTSVFAAIAIVTNANRSSLNESETSAIANMLAARKNTPLVACEVVPKGIELRAWGSSNKSKSIRRAIEPSSHPAASPQRVALSSQLGS